MRSIRIFIGLSTLFFLGTIFATKVEALEYCFGTAAREVTSRDCSNYSSSYYGYCANSGVNTQVAYCNLPDCWSPNYIYTYSKCTDNGTPVYDHNAACNGNSGTYSTQIKAYQCYVTCDENLWSDCPGCESVQVNDCEEERACGGSCCTATSPSAPTAVSPAAPFTAKTATVNLTWTAPLSWGTECSSGTRGYDVCMSAASDAACATPTFVSGEATLNYVTSSTVANNYWKVRAQNKDGSESGWSSVNNFCFAGDDPVNPLSVTAWSACSSATHLRTRSCIAGCDCTGVSLSEICQGEIRGTLFDASYRDVCPGNDLNGYLVGLGAEEYVSNQTFAVIDQDGSAPAGWSSNISATTTLQGNYAATVYAPATYEYDFSNITGFDTSAAPKLVCSSSFASVVGNATSCLVQPCTILGNMSFGFWRIFGGWWQAVGGNVYGANGVHSFIPPVLPAASQRLILADAGRYGLLAYGTLDPQQLGSSTDARVSDVLWEVQSRYSGLRYDYNFYKTRMDVFASTPWTGGSISYNDGGVGYQIFKGTGDLGLDATTLAVGQKAIILVGGSVSVNGDLEVPDGAFLAVIARNGVTFSSGVDTAQGWFVAESINVSCNETAGVCDQTDTQFDGQGSFVGWTGINLERDMGLGNNSAPSEKFTYRSDFFINAPTPMKVYARKFSPFIP